MAIGSSSLSPIIVTSSTKRSKRSARDRLRQGVELGSLLKNLREHFHERCSSLRVSMVAKGNASHQATLDVRREKIGHGHDGRVPQRLLLLLQLIAEQTLLLLLCLRVLAGRVRRWLMLVGHGTLVIVQIVAAVVEEIHEESEVFQEQLRLGFHQISPVALLGLQRKRVEKRGHRLHRRLIQFACQMLILIDHELRGVDVPSTAHAHSGGGLSEGVHLVELMRVAHDPVGEILDEFVAELDLLAEGEIVASLDHRLHQLTDANANGHGPDAAVQVTRVAHDVQDQLFQTDDVRQRVLVDLLGASTAAARTGAGLVRRATDGGGGRWTVVRVGRPGSGAGRRAFQRILSGLLSLDFEDRAHDDDDVVDELRVLLGTDHLSVGVEELVHLDLDLIEENRIAQRIQLVTEQILNVPLDLQAELLVLTDERFETIADELRHRTVVQIGTDRFHGGAPAVRRNAVLTRSVLHRQPDAAQGAEKARHVRPFVKDVFDLVFTGMNSRPSLAELRVTAAGQSAGLVGVDRGRAGRRSSAGQIFDALRIDGEELRRVLLADEGVVPGLFVAGRGELDATEKGENALLQGVPPRGEQRARGGGQLHVDVVIGQQGENGRLVEAEANVRLVGEESETGHGDLHRLGVDGPEIDEEDDLQLRVRVLGHGNVRAEIGVLLVMNKKGVAKNENLSQPAQDRSVLVDLVENELLRDGEENLTGDRPEGVDRSFGIPQFDVASLVQDEQRFHRRVGDVGHHRRVVNQGDESVDQLEGRHLSLVVQFVRVVQHQIGIDGDQPDDPEKQLAVVRTFVVGETIGGLRLERLRVLRTQLLRIEENVFQRAHAGDAGDAQRRAGERRRLRDLVQSVGEHVSQFSCPRIDDVDLRPPGQTLLRDDAVETFDQHVVEHRRRGEIQTHFQHFGVVRIETKTGQEELDHQLQIDVDLLRAARERFRRIEENLFQIADHRLNHDEENVVRVLVVNVRR